jgi:F-type H+-transporting ATPase subunit delta
VAEPRTVARPYAEAVFRLADAAGKLAEWSAMLSALAQVSESERIRSAVRNPANSAAKAAGIFVSVLAGHLTGEAENFVRVLADNRRLELISAIRDQFEALRNERESVVDVDITSAIELSDPQLKELVASLEKKTGRKVKARVNVDKGLIGGVMLAIGDKVIDGSARAKLAALGNALKS